jgi:hypothetical protein
MVEVRWVGRERREGEIGGLVGEGVKREADMWVPIRVVGIEVTNKG